jgi:hypothetical protein
MVYSDFSLFLRAWRRVVHRDWMIFWPPKKTHSWRMLISHAFPIIIGWAKKNPVSLMDFGRKLA